MGVPLCHIVDAGAAFAVALDRDGAEDWLDLARALAGLDARHAGALAFVALEALPEAAAMDVIDAYANAGGWPVPPFVTLAEEARAWALAASPRERKFYAWACLEALGPQGFAAVAGPRERKFYAWEMARRLSPEDRRALAAEIAALDRPAQAVAEDAA